MKYSRTKTKRMQPTGNVSLDSTDNSKSRKSGSSRANNLRVLYKPRSKRLRSGRLELAV